MKNTIPLCGLVDIDITEEQCDKLRELGVYPRGPYERDAEYPVLRRNARGI